MKFKLNDITIYPYLQSFKGGILTIESHFPKEIIPPWEVKNKKWQGYPTLFHAITVCAAHKYPSVIVEVGSKVELMGYGNTFCKNYKVYEIRRVKKFSIPKNYTITCYQPGVRLMHFFKGPKGKWVDHVGKVTFPDFKESIVMYTGLHEDEVIVIRDLDKLDETASDVRMNFCFELSKGAFTRPYDFDESLKDPNLTPKVKCFMGKTAYNHIEISMGCSMVHECMHSIEYYRALALIKMWRQSKVKSNFFQWVIKEANKKGFSKNDLLIIGISLAIVDDEKSRINETSKITKLYKKFNLIQSSEILHMYPNLEAFKLKAWLYSKNPVDYFLLYFMDDLNSMDDCYGINAPPNWVEARKGHKALAEKVCNEIVKVVTSLNFNKKLKDAIKEKVIYTIENKQAGICNEKLSENPGAFLKLLYAKLAKAM